VKQKRVWNFILIEYKMSNVKPLKRFSDLDIAIELFYPKNSDKIKARNISKYDSHFRNHLIRQAKIRIANAINIVYANRPNTRSIIKNSIMKHPIAARHIVIVSRRYRSPVTSTMQNKFASPNTKRRRTN
jgi:hypothetical protein